MWLPATGDLFHKFGPEHGEGGGGGQIYEPFMIYGVSSYLHTYYIGKIGYEY